MKQNINQLIEYIKNVDNIAKENDSLKAIVKQQKATINKQEKFILSLESKLGHNEEVELFNQFESNPSSFLDTDVSKLLSNRRIHYWYLGRFQKVFNEFKTLNEAFTSDYFPFTDFRGVGQSRSKEIIKLANGIRTNKIQRTRKG